MDTNPQFNTRQDRGGQQPPVHQTTPMGRPTQSPVYTDPDPVQAPQGPSKMLLGLMGAGLLVAGGGLVYKMVHTPEPKVPVVRAPSPWEQQQQIMREAMDMAREAQQMQREHQAEMRRAMEMEYGGEFTQDDW